MPSEIVNGRSFSVPGAGIRFRRQSGASFIELSLVAAVLLLLFVAATDLSLSILARQQIHSAARAGMEYAIARGYDSVGIQKAVTNAFGPQSVGILRLASIDESGVSSSLTCACYGALALGVSPNRDTTTGKYTCPSGASDICSAPAAGGVPIPLAPYVTVRVTGSYSPILKLYWPNLTNGIVPITSTYVGRVSFRT